MVSVICCPVSPAILSAIGINSTRTASTTTTPKIISGGNLDRSMFTVSSPLRRLLAASLYLEAEF